jgi:hypothetical protein
MSNCKSFGIRWKGNLYKSVYVKKTKKYIVFGAPKLNIHITYDIKSGDLHWTVEKVDVEKSNAGGLKVITSDKKHHIFTKAKRPPLDKLVDPISIQTSTAFTEKQKQISLPKRYKLVNLDAFDCKVPNIQMFLSPPNYYRVKKIRWVRKGKTKIVKFNDVWAILRFIDVAQPIITERS